MSTTLSDEVWKLKNVCLMVASPHNCGGTFSRVCNHFLLAANRTPILCVMLAANRTPILYVMLVANRTPIFYVMLAEARSMALKINVAGATVGRMSCGPR